MKKHVWIMNHYAGWMPFDHGGRHYSFAKYLKREGYEPVVFCCNAMHGKPERHYDTEELWQEHQAEEISVPFVYVRGRIYTGNGKQRVLNMVDFYRNVQKAAKEYAKLHSKPDIILASSVHPLTLVAGIKLAKYFGVECICEVRDLWPESIVEYSSRFTNEHLLIKLLYQGEKWIYKKADKLIFTMEGGAQYIADRGWDTAHGGPIDLKKVFYINNGVDLEVFQYNQEHCQIADPDLESPDTFKVIYTGAIRKVNNLGILLDAAKEETDPRVKFLIWGDGDELSALEQRLVDENIVNVVFKGRVEKKYIPYIVSKADTNYIHGDNLPLFRFGISPNKLFDYFAAEKPVLMDMKPGYNPVEQFDCGFVSETQEELLENIQKVAILAKEEYQSMCSRSAAAAKEYDFKNLTKKLIQIMEG